MSTNKLHAPRDSHGPTTNGHEIAENPSAPPADSAEVIGRVVTRVPDRGLPEAVEQFIADVLCRAHAAAENDNQPDEARATLHVAFWFAEELTTTNPAFDRLRFIQAATRL